MNGGLAIAGACFGNWLVFGVNTLAFALNIGSAWQLVGARQW